MEESMSAQTSRKLPKKPTPVREDVDGTRAAIESGDTKAQVKAIYARFPKTMARLAK